MFVIHHCLITLLYLNQVKSTHSSQVAQSHQTKHITHTAVQEVQEEVDQKSDEVEVEGSEGTSDELKSEVTGSIVTHELPLAVSNLLRYGKTRGINTTMWFTPPQGWTSAEGEKLVEGEFFIEKLTHLGLGLAVGRPVKEQLLIEEALSSHNLREAVKVASQASVTRQTTLRQATERPHTTTDMSSTSQSGQVGQCVDIDWLVSTLGLSYEESPKSDKERGNLGEEGVQTERVQTYAFSKKLFEGDGQLKEGTHKEERSWESVAVVVEDRLKNMCRFHRDKFYKLRASLNMLEPTSTVSTVSSASIYSDVSRVGAAAAAVFHKCEDHSMSQSVSQSVSSDSKGVDMKDMVSMSELKKALRVGEFNGWKLCEVEALVRMVTHTLDTDITPTSVDRSALKE